ncbi:hypothetical protein BJX64DRAFT_291879 [Aspergillus heterothallicus]
MPPQQLIFINGPSISSSVSSEERRLIRSQIASRGRNSNATLGAAAPLGTKLAVSTVASCVENDDDDLEPDSIDSTTPQDLQIWTPVSGVQFEPSPASGVSFFDRQTRDAVDYRLRVILPDFRQLEQYAEKYFRAFVPEAKNKPLAISATVLNALVHKSTTRLVNRDQQMIKIRAARHKVIQLMRQELAEDYRLPDLLSAILILATTAPAPAAVPSRKEINPFTPPSLGSQWLEVYIRKPISEVHWQAIETLLRMHGGIHQLKTYGSAWQISIALTVTRPPYPLISPEGHEYPDVSTLSFLGMENAPASVSAPGGFFLLQIENIKRSVIRRFVDLRESVWVVEILHSSSTGCSRFPTLAPAPPAAAAAAATPPRSSTPPPADIPQARAIYSACLCTALLFSTHVIFPLPAPSAPCDILLDRLVTALSSVDIAEEILTPGWAEMSLWCAFIGGIAGLYSEGTRKYFVARVKGAALACGIES